MFMVSGYRISAEISETSASANRVHLITFSSTEITSDDFIPGAGFAIASRSDAGLFGTIDELLSPAIPASVRLLRLRSINDGIRATGNGTYGDQFSIIIR